ncbi:hypothetical protein BVC80_8727g19 [Macleaya cordata]|uniref:Uncharacterized protein n=1 Tax=Macleaya cordata TaxID=56857 RepID=A0A200Q8N5_MACCD|nr:hypothetical protein BVC80_8727g19 [Macleaya cordata]
MATTSRNGNQGFFPFAFAVVSSEYDANWNWFLSI